MFVNWSGRGLWALLILLVGLTVPGLGIAIAAERFPSFTASPCFTLPLALGLAAAGVACWVLGRRWNATDTSDTGHTLYFLPVEYWGIIALLIATTMIVRSVAM